MKRCWLHIGMHKTGTTSLQANLKRIGETSKWKYISIDGKLHMNTAFHAMFATDPFKYHWFAKQGISPEALNEKGAKLRTRLAATISKSRAETIIMSAEALPLIDKEGIVRLKEFLDPLFDEIRVIGYVRPPVSFKISIFQEMVKGGRSKFDVGGIKVNYRRKFEKFDQVFGPENVILRKFDPATFDHGCTVSDYFATIGLDSPERSTIQRANESMSRNACGILFAYRKFGPGYGSGSSVIAENVRLIQVLLAMNGPKFTAAKSMVAAGLANEAADLKWMETRLGTNLDENLADNGGIACEAELLEIPRAALEEFAACFEKIHGSAVPANQIPPGDPADPVKIAELVEFCRGVIRSNMESQRAEDARRRQGFRSLWRNLCRKIRKAARRS